MDRDLGIMRAIRETIPEWSVPIFEATALLGDELLVVAALLAYAAIDAYRSIKSGSDRPLSRRTGFVLAVVLGGLAFTLILKASFGFSRPPESLQAVARDGDGFPSGHTMAATICWGALALWGSVSTRQRRLLGAAAVVALVGFSRLALGVHYVADLVASVLFGTAFLLAAGAVLYERPERAFVVAVALGGLALLATGGATDGLLAFVGCAGGAAAWWAINRPEARRLWTAVAG
nr:phosphatase PAP2 family protein [Natrononativus amylolyticus]